MEDFYCDQVLNNKVVVKKVFETENTLAFYHTKPYWPIHIIVIPKKHIDSLLTLDSHDDIVSELVETIKHVASDVNKESGSCRVLTNLGNYQDSQHLHFHVCSGEHL